MIREEKNIKGISIGETEHKISRYADDTEIILEGDRNSFERTLKIIGKKIRSNLESGEDQCHMATKQTNSPVRHMPHLNMEWNPPKFKILGSWSTRDMKQCKVINFHEFF